MCKSINGSLLEVESESEHQIISEELQKLHPEQSGYNLTYWTGLIDLREEGTFVWTDTFNKPDFDVTRLLTFLLLNFDVTIGSNN